MGAGNVTFDFAVHVLPKGASPSKVIRVDTNVDKSAVAYRIVRSDGEALLLFDDRPAGTTSPLMAAGLSLEGRVGVAVDDALISDAKLSWQRSHLERERPNRVLGPDHEGTR